MARLSDLIEEFIKDLFMEAQDMAIEIQRNELANMFNCAPSQINYVLATRFSHEKGYIIESRRGGGGHIRIIKLKINRDETLYKLINSIGDTLSMTQAASIVEFLVEKGIIKDREGNIMLAAVDNRAFNVESEIKNQLRASIFKSMLASLLR